jgi:hypothetical protein
MGVKQPLIVYIHIISQRFQYFNVDNRLFKRMNRPKRGSKSLNQKVPFLGYRKCVFEALI